MSSKSIYPVQKALEILDEMFPVQTAHSQEYTDLVITNLKNPPESDFIERHHFLPRYDGGDKEIVTLHFRDHIKSHLLLALHYLEIGDKMRTRNNAAAVNACKKNSPVRHKKLQELTESERDELFDYYEQVSKEVSDCYKGENNGFYGKEHSPETIEKILRSRGFSRDGVNVFPLERTEESTKLRDYYYGVVRNIKFGTNRIVEVIRNHNGNLAAIPYDDFNLDDFSYVPWDRRSEVCFNTGIGKGRPGEEKSVEHKRKIREFALSEKGIQRILNINKDPEKIRKTAEKHRGMKRSVETCKNISEALKGRPGSNIGATSYYHPENLRQVYLMPTDDIPEGYIKGNLGTLKAQYYHQDTYEPKKFRLKETPSSEWIKGVAPTGPSPFQLRELDQIRDIEIFKSKLVGYSEILIQMLYDATFNRVQNQVVATTDGVQLTGVLREMISKLKILKPHLIENTRNIIRFHSGGIILFRTATPKKYLEIDIDKLYAHIASDNKMDTILKGIPHKITEYTRIHI